MWRGIKVHSMILDDPSLAEAALDHVIDQGWNAEWAVSSQADHLANQFAEFDDPYLRERGRDVQQVTDRVLKELAGMRGLRSAGEPAIYVAADIAPSDMLSLKNALGFAIDLGGTTSHTAILARSMNVPAVVGLNCASELIEDDEWLILDGQAGLVIVAPDEPLLAEYRHRQAASLLEREKLRRLVHVPGNTWTAWRWRCMANIEMPEEAEQAREVGADGIGLFRSEFLFLNRRDLPTEDEQYEAYRAAVLAMRGKPVTIRTLDVGADKALDEPQAAVSPNPALGLRAIRFCLAEPSMFLAQLRAILRASAHGPVRILIPMLAHNHEIEQSLVMIAQAREQLLDRGQPFADHVPVGGMIEVPAAALSVSLFLRRLDFLSIGTNDLIQYTLAIDRADHAVAQLYDPFHPAVLKLIAMTIRAARRAGKPVAVCGELAGELSATRLLLGMGLQQFSMHAASLLPVKREVLLSDVSALSPGGRGCCSPMNRCGCRRASAVCSASCRPAKPNANKACVLTMTGRPARRCAGHPRHRTPDTRARCPCKLCSSSWWPHCCTQPGTSRPRKRAAAMPSYC
ncbi:MAG: phosphoenolpyruvate--protein phosphotransferase [Burkholderiaceae bacterium]|nr:phosphoenolpyruvate--protein phosphotransferase [Burkholderiaceae bacterium]